MTMNKHDKVAVIGMGKTGQSAIKHLQRLHIACEGFDEAPITLTDELQHVVLHTGALDVETLQAFDRVIVSPGMDWRHPVLLGLRDAGVVVHGDLDEFLACYSNRLLAVTGTNGKTTTTQMIALLLETLVGGCDAGGNIGIPMLDLLADQEPERVVLELSSFQLERSISLHPSWAVLLNIQPDHADMHDSPEAYRAAKIRIFEQMGIDDIALLPVDLECDMLSSELAFKGIRVARFGILAAEDSRADMLKAGVICQGQSSEHCDSLFWTQEGERKFIPCSALMVKGLHQQQNIAVAAQAAADFGVSSAVIEEAMLSFQGLEHRLEYVGHVAGRDWFNDSKATNPDATLAALSSFEKVTWICGGLRKGLSLDCLTEAVKKHVSFACVVGKDTKAYVALLKQAGVPFVVSKTIEKAVKDAHGKAKGAVLLSPAAASQDQFRNYAERGQAFVTSLRALEGKQ